MEAFETTGEKLLGLIKEEDSGEARQNVAKVLEGVQDRYTARHILCVSHRGLASGSIYKLQKLCMMYSTTTIVLHNRYK